MFQTPRVLSVKMGVLRTKCINVNLYVQHIHMVVHIKFRKMPRTKKPSYEHELQVTENVHNIENIHYMNI